MEGEPKLYIFTVAFNEPWFIQLQHDQLNKHLDNDFVYCVYDNSSKSLACYKIKRFCKQNGISYNRVQDNLYTGKDPSRSHAYALNSIFQEVQRNPQISHFGVLDHDIFPFANTNLLSKLQKQTAFGLKQERNDSIYLWPGYMFFDASVIDQEIDCMPSEKGDTAAELGKYLNNQMQFADQEHKKFFDHGSAQADMMEVIDSSWIHLINGSDWAGVGMQEKKQKLQEILKSPEVLELSK